MKPGQQEQTNCERMCHLLFGPQDSNSLLITRAFSHDPAFQANITLNVGGMVELPRISLTAFHHAHLLANSSHQPDLSLTLLW
jgi:hypothetical protein